MIVSLLYCLHGERIAFVTFYIQLNIRDILRLNTVGLCDSLLLHINISISSRVLSFCFLVPSLHSTAVYSEGRTSFSKCEEEATVATTDSIMNGHL